jgi:hypothetical protein
MHGIDECCCSCSTLNGITSKPTRRDDLLIKDLLFPSHRSQQKKIEEGWRVPYSTLPKNPEKMGSAGLDS